jgi:hypothetical protein
MDNERPNTPSGDVSAAGKASDLERIHAAEERLNAEAADVLEYQAPFEAYFPATLSTVAPKILP